MANDALTLILTSLASGPKHGHALALDIDDFAGVRLGPGSLYGAITRLEERGLIEPLPSEQRRQPYQLTPAGRVALAEAIADLQRIVEVGAGRLASPSRRVRSHDGRAGMSRVRSHRALLRWYPPDWRARYGDEFLAMVEDTVGSGRAPLALRASSVRSALRQRVRATGLVGSDRSADLRRRSGALLVLGAWAVVVFAGAVFAKTSEHYEAHVSAARRTMAVGAFDAVVAAAVAGLAVVVLAAAVALPALRRTVRADGASRLRTATSRGLLATVVAVAMTVVVVVVAHHTSLARADQGLRWQAGLLVGAWALSIAALLGAWTTAAAEVGIRLRFTGHELRVEMWLAAVLAAAVVVVGVAVAVWWTAMGEATRRLPDGSGAGMADPQLIVAVALLGAAIAAAGYGVGRMVRSGT